MFLYLRTVPIVLICISLPLWNKISFVGATSSSAVSSCNSKTGEGCLDANQTNGAQKYQQENDDVSEPIDLDVSTAHRTTSSHGITKMNSRKGVSKKKKKKHKTEKEKTKKKTRKTKGQKDEAKKKLPFGVWWFAPFFSGGGYCSEAIGFALALHNHVQLKITHHGDSVNTRFMQGLPIRTSKLLRRLNEEKANPETNVVICHSEPGAWNPPRYETSLCPPEEEPLYSIGRTMFETHTIPSEWMQRCNNMDEIWVPTEFHRNTFVNAGVVKSKVFVIPEPVDVDRFNPATVSADANLGWFSKLMTAITPNAHPAQDSFTFLSIFKWEQRKGWDVLLSAYIQQFSAVDSVSLLLLTNKFHTEDNLVAKVKQFVANQVEQHQHDNPMWLPPTINLIDTHVPEEELVVLYKSVDCFVLPSRGEGWGRPHVEAMAMGLPVIATNWSGPTAFLNEDNGYPLHIDGLATVTEGPYRKHHMWAVPSLEHLKSLMKEVVENPNAARLKGELARRSMVEKFSPKVVADLTINRLAQIGKHLKEEGIL
eukprot:m.138235 g.138235  ORF g.138235 m.138235 type:complete len:538 (+) comp29979_c0_seq2:51-1664(+)